MQLHRILLDKRLLPHEAASLAGKLQFVAQSLFGRASAAALRPLHQRAQAAQFRSTCKGWALNKALESSILWLRRRLQHGRLRIIEYHVTCSAVVYADAFFELGGQRWHVRRPAGLGPDTASELCQWVGLSSLQSFH